MPAKHRNVRRENLRLSRQRTRQRCSFFILFSTTRRQPDRLTIDRPGNIQKRRSPGRPLPQPESLQRSPKATQNETIYRTSLLRHPGGWQDPGPWRSGRPGRNGNPLGVVSHSTILKFSGSHARRRRVGIAAGLQPRRSEGSIPSRRAIFLRNTRG